MLTDDIDFIFETAAAIDARVESCGGPQVRPNSPPSNSALILAALLNLAAELRDANIGLDQIKQKLPGESSWRVR